MRHIADTKLDFSDVLIVPKRSTLVSRDEVKLIRDFTFRNSDIKIIITSSFNIKKIGSFAGANAFRKNLFLLLISVVVLLHRQYN